MSTEAKALPGKYLVCQIGRGEYGLSVSHIREITDSGDIASVPQAPGWLLGVRDLRGKVTQVVSLGKRLGIAEETAGEHPCLVVAGNTDVPIGFLVDGVSEVIDVHTADIEPVPDFGCSPVEWVSGISKANGKLRLLLDLPALLQLGKLHPAPDFSPFAAKQG